MGFGLGFSLHLNHAAPRFASSVVASPTLTASTLTRTSAVSAYPPTISFTRPIDWQDGDKAVMQWSTDYTFATGVSETATPVTLTVAVTTYNFGLSAIVSGVYYMRLGAWRGTRPANINWSNLQGVGDAVAPTITSSATTTGSQFVAGTFALTASKTSTWAIVGGADMAQFSISGSTLSWVAQSVAAALTVQVQATSLFGVASTIQTITDTIAVNTPSAFSFTPVTGATRSTLYTSNTITVAGLTGGAVVPVAMTGAGQYSKNGGAYTSAAGTAVNGDTFSIQETSSASYSIATSGTLTIGTTAGAYSVTTQSNPANVPVYASTAAPAIQNVAFASATATFSAQSIGAADATRYVIVSIYSNDTSTNTPSSVTVQGITATRVGSQNTFLSMWKAAVPTGTTADVVVTTPAALSVCGIAVGSLTSANNIPTETPSLTYGFNNSPQGVAVNTPSNAVTVVAAFYLVATGTPVWANTTASGGDTLAQGASTTLATAHRITAGAATVSTSGMGNQNSGMIAASFGP